MKAFKVIAITLLGFTLIGCDVEDVQEVVAVISGVDDSVVEPDPSAIYMPDTDPNAMCNGLVGSFAIPCSQVLDVCILTSDGNLTSKWVPEVQRCTANHPTWEDVCRIAPPSQWGFYGYTSEECSAAFP